MNENIKELIAKNELVKGTPFNDKAWKYFLSEARKDKQWAKSVTLQWTLDASEAAKQMRDKFLKTPVIVLAVESYCYSYYRATAKQGIWYVAPATRDLWISFGALEETK